MVGKDTETELALPGAARKGNSHPCSPWGQGKDGGVVLKVSTLPAEA